MALPDETLWPYVPNARRSTSRIDWFSIPDESFHRANRARIRSLDAKDAHKLYSDDRLTRQRSLMPEEALDALDLMLTGTTPERAPASNPKQALRDQLEAEIEQLKSDAANQGNVAGQVQALKLHADLFALLNQKEEKVDPVINIYVISGVEKDADG